MTSEHDSLGFEKLVGAITASVVNSSSSGVLKDDTKHEKKKQMSNWKGSITTIMSISMNINMY